MKKIIQTIKDIWTIEDLRNKILLTLGFMAIYRFAAQIPLPGIDITAAQAALQNQTSGGGILGLMCIPTLHLSGGLNHLHHLQQFQYQWQ